MNELTRSLVLEAGQKPHYRKRAKFRFEAFRHEVEVLHAVRVRTGPGATLAERAVRLARVFWPTPECFDPDDLCDNCSITLARRMSASFWFFWLDRHPEWALDPLDEAEVVALLFEAPAVPPAPEQCCGQLALF